MAKKSTSIRITDEAKSLLEALAKRLGISQAAVMEVAIRNLAKKEGLR